MNLNLISIIEKFDQARVLCIGDIMLDHYIHGEVNRISPEAPVPILRVIKEENRLGGASNVLNNLCSLKTDSYFLSVVGNDITGELLKNMIHKLKAKNQIIVEDGRITTRKTRYISDVQQLLRADNEERRSLTEKSRKEFLKTLKEILLTHHTVIISDYNKGIFDNNFASEIIDLSRRAGATVVVDPKGTDYSLYLGANILKPNIHELEKSIGRPLKNHDEIIDACRHLIDQYQFDAVLVTQGKDGMTLVRKNSADQLAKEAKEVYDVTGAGDTVIAALSAALSIGASYSEATRIANIAAGIVVGKVGTAVVHREELLKEISAEPNKILPLKSAVDIISKWKRNGQKIGFTNGCFDLVHPGHLSLLKSIKKVCDKLVIGLNSDESVRRLKGIGRPIQTVETRGELLSYLENVDLIIVFNEETPLKLIEAIRPDILAKGSDYKHDSIVGANFVESYGGQILIIDLVPGYSTSEIIRKISN